MTVALQIIARFLGFWGGIQQFGAAVRTCVYAAVTSGAERSSRVCDASFSGLDRVIGKRSVLESISMTG